jgi:hypothetical protein
VRASARAFVAKPLAFHMRGHARQVATISPSAWTSVGKLTISDG